MLFTNLLAGLGMNHSLAWFISQFLSILIFDVVLLVMIAYLLLADRKTTENAYVTAGPFAVMYPPDVRIDTKAKDRVVRLIAGSLERYLGQTPA